jgi:predicted outer membrane protein
MKKHLLLAACSLAAALVLMPDEVSAQVADSTKKDTSAVRPAPPPTQNRPDANAAARPAGSISDSAIIAMLQLSHTQQIAAAELAGQRAQSDRVKQFAETLKNDHGKALQELEAFASRLQAGDTKEGMPSGVGRDNNVTGRRDSAMVKPDSSAMTPDSAKMGRDNNANVGRRDSVAAQPKPEGQPDVSFENISGLSGHEFDHGFVRLQVQHHETEINHLRNDVIPMIKNSDLKALVQGQLPILGRHLTTARELEGVLKTTN